ncbi:MAG: hypothetical protein DI596_01960 [Azospira oryzae]|nr:MAG: hypothetical protein DI596_01960 [Azospira oryzae]PZP82385.1 MAG: hypothetical protein DI593_01960 [Azospira oryzae]
MFEILRLEIKLLQTVILFLWKALAFAGVAVWRGGKWVAAFYAARKAAKAAAAQPVAAAGEPVFQVKRREPLLLEAKPIEGPEGPYKWIVPPLKTSFEDAGAQEPAQEAEARPQPRSAKKKPAARKVATTRRREEKSSDAVSGVLMGSGLRVKTRKDGTRYQAYCVDVRTGDGNVIEIVGTDLERALMESGARPGDRVVAVKRGVTRVTLPDGSTARKNLWSVTVRGAKKG